MCEIGDIIVVKSATVNGKQIGKHSFIVLNVDEGQIEGMDFDLIGSMMSSFDGKGDSYRQRKLSYSDNIPYNREDVNVPGGNKKEGFVKAGVLFYFNRSSIDYRIIGRINTNLYLQIIDYIENYDGKLIAVTENLK